MLFPQSRSWAPLFPIVLLYLATWVIYKVLLVLLNVFQQDGLDGLVHLVDELLNVGAVGALGMVGFLGEPEADELVVGAGLRCGPVWRIWEIRITLQVRSVRQIRGFSGTRTPRG